MTSSTIAKLNSQHTRFSRGLALVMLVLVFYGTTVEAAHKHRNILGIGDPVTSTSVSGVGNTSVNANLTGCSDCLICQLHQTFSATLVFVRPNINSSQLRSHFYRAAQTLLQSLYQSPRTGRAPPLSN